MYESAGLIPSTSLVGRGVVSIGEHEAHREELVERRDVGGPPQGDAHRYGGLERTRPSVSSSLIGLQNDLRRTSASYQQTSNVGTLHFPLE